MEPSDMTSEQFEAWGIVDLFGHQRIAGRISQQVFGGETFVRVDIPTATGEFHTRLFGKGAIYGMSFTDEPIAREAADQYRHNTRPVEVFTIRHLIEDQRNESGD